MGKNHDPLDDLLLDLVTTEHPDDLDDEKDPLEDLYSTFVEPAGDDSVVDNTEDIDYSDNSDIEVQASDTAEEISTKSKRTFGKLTTEKKSTTSASSSFGSLTSGKKTVADTKNTLSIPAVNNNEPAAPIEKKTFGGLKPIKKTPPEEVASVEAPIEENKPSKPKPALKPMSPLEPPAEEAPPVVNAVDQEENTYTGELPERPLDKPGMNEIIVTADGRSLSDMLPHLRSGNRRFETRVDELVDPHKAVKVNGKTRTDNRYVSHVIEGEKKKAEDKARHQMGNQFIQRNAKYTEEEKTIMRNLGITNEQFTKLMGSKKHTEAQKEWILAAGKGGIEKNFKGRRYRTSIGDKDIIDFLAKFKFANTRILRWLRNEPQSQINGKLHRLKANGLVTSTTIIGMPDLWSLTEAGVAFSNLDTKPMRRAKPKYSTIPPVLGANYIAACLWNNTVSVLNLDDYPAQNRIIADQGDFDRVQGEMLVSELEIRRSLGREIEPSTSSMYEAGSGGLYKHVAAKVEAMWRKWELGGKQGPSPEFELGNELLWILYPQQDFTAEYHVPDLVVKRERGPNNEPRSIAVEIELAERAKIDKYIKTALAYKLDKRAYEQVIWVTPNAKVSRMIQKGAAEVGFDRYDVVPVYTATGIYRNRDIWLI